MNAKELIESGLIELYALGIASDEERSMVESLAAKSEVVRRELSEVNDAIATYAVANAIAPADHLKDLILNAIEPPDKVLPPVLSANSTVDEWIRYLEQNKVEPPQNFEGIYFLELPGTESYYTYAVWGKHGDFVDDETHNDHNEYLLICSGECEMNIGGKKSKHKRGDFLTITPGITHSAVVTGNELMLVIGQRRAA